MISFKSPQDSLSDFAIALKKAKDANGEVAPHYEIAFDNKKDFNRFVKNIYILMCINSLKPQSYYELSKIMNIVQSNLNKIMFFFENIGVIKIKKRKIDGRYVKTPIVDYDKIEFNLKAA